jgi:hypothetical protein
LLAPTVCASAVADAAHVGHFPLQVPKDHFDKTKLTEGVGDVDSCAASTGTVLPRQAQDKQQTDLIDKNAFC